MTGSSAPRPLILASGSAARRRMLAAAGLVFDVVPATIDEEKLRDAAMAHSSESGHANLAVLLAAAKAEDVSRRHPKALVIGSDQILSGNGRVFSKPDSIDEARNTLVDLRGRTHELHSAVALAEGGKTVWTSVETARLTMRDLSDAAIESYLQDVGNAIIGCVGAYQIEAAGIRLFESVSGDHFTIQGMPLLPLLAELRARREIE